MVGRRPRAHGGRGDRRLADLRDGLQFEQSHAHPGLRIADLVAYVVRDAVLRSEDERTQLAFELLRPKLRYLGGPT